MKAFQTLLVLVMALRGKAQSNPVSEYSTLQNLCESGGIDSVNSWLAIMLFKLPINALIELVRRGHV